MRNNSFQGWHPICDNNYVGHEQHVLIEVLFEVAVNKPRSATVFFGNKLSLDEFDNESFRRELVERGLSCIMANADGLRVVNRNLVACTASFVGTPDSISALVNFVSSRQLGTVEVAVFEKPSVRAAID